MEERQRMRQYYGNVWRKRCEGLPLEGLEQLVAEVILQHPEYQPLLEQEDYASREFLPELGETNPFLHMGLHTAIREQIGADRPSGRMINGIHPCSSCPGNAKTLCNLVGCAVAYPDAEAGSLKPVSAVVLSLADGCGRLPRHELTKHTVAIADQDSRTEHVI